MRANEEKARINMNMFSNKDTMECVKIVDVLR